MGKTADVHQSIWSDPWFADLSVEAKLLYFWAITNEHANLAGIYIVGRRLIEFESGLTSSRFERAIAELQGKLVYDESTGTIWVVGRVKRVRSRTAQIAKSIARAVEECEVSEIRTAFLAKYGCERWLEPALGDLASQAGNGEPHPRFTRTSPEVPSQSQSQSQSQQKNQLPQSAATPLSDLLADLIAKNGSRRPRVGKRWADAERLLLEADDRDPQEAERLIRWCQADEFWRANVLSMPKFRERYDQLRLQAQRNGGGFAQASAFRPMPGEAAA